jgi:uncharacterized membrane protein YphA (DoxX/SURF4 family)
MQKFVFSVAALTLIFFMAGLNKIRNFTDTAKGLMKRIPFLTSYLPASFFSLVIALVILLEVCIPPMMVYSAMNTGQYVRHGATALLIFTLLATLLYHFPPTRSEHRMPFLYNTAIMGGLALLI